MEREQIDQEAAFSLWPMVSWHKKKNEKVQDTIQGTQNCLSVYPHKYFFLVRRFYVDASISHAVCFFFVFVFCFLSTCAHDEIVCLRRPRSNRHPKVAYIGTQSGQVGKMSQASLRIKVYRTRAPWHFLLFFLTFPLIPNLHRVTKCASKCTKKPRDTRNGGYINFHFAQIRKFASSAQFASPLPPWRNTSG